MTDTLSVEGATSADANRLSLSRAQANLVFATVALGLLLSALDQTVVATALPTIVSDPGGAGHLSWVVTSYLRPKRYPRRWPEGSATLCRSKESTVTGPATARAGIRPASAAPPQTDGRKSGFGRTRN